MKRSFRMISQILIVLSDTEEILNSDSDEENKLLFLTEMRKKQRKLEKKLLNEDDHAVLLSIPMIGSGVPTEPDQITQRTLPEDAIGAPYFYYEQIHLSNLMIGSAKLTERICKALEAYDNEPPSIVQNDAEVTFYCLSISLKTDVQELNDVRLEQLIRFLLVYFLAMTATMTVSSAAPKFTLPYPTLPEPWKGHNEYNPDKENNWHGRGSNDASRLEPISQYNQSAGSDLFMAL
ncbi:hypothetical protein F3Y22_tig00110450pilonHSYRG00499 [Hibiscus syriacus]|uniref:Uncharacterized protein n=1 Tax=Hibiscus syriacus TaxID=106335 RepID=A0A6A3AK62_HIBSY|nr:hypothetical protein F3Y22_tig00110450pilonHSYRG00499 [Hibiscus syriacus]